jgi:DNA ligase (NAD+)
MMDTKIVQRTKDLQKELNGHIYRYYVLNAPMITDGEYDKLYHELMSLEEQYPELRTPDSPTQRVGSDLSEDLPKVQHVAPILSLSNAFSVEDLQRWEERNLKLMPTGTHFEYVLEPKLDGLSIVLTYVDGVLVTGATRGNGEQGDDVTANVRTISTVPLRIPINPDAKVIAPSRLVVRGEILIHKTDFEKLNTEQTAKGLETYVNARNTASGSLKQKDSRITAQRPLTAYMYDIVDIDGEIPATEWDTLQFMRNLGFNVPQVELYQDLDGVIAQLPTWESRRHLLVFEVDGIVLKINHVAQRRELGFSGKDPKGSTAYKFPSEEATTRLKDVTINIGRTGKVTPTAILEPVFVSGVTVSNATLHNYEMIQQLDIRYGDTVIVKRSGEVIPYVIGPVEGARNGTETPIQAPTHCPFCSTALARPGSAVDLFCVNPKCAERVYRSLEFFVSKSAMDIEGMGPQTIKQLIANGKITDEADLFYLQPTDFSDLEGFGEKKITNALNAIEVAKTRPLAQFLGSLGIDGAGSTVSVLLTDNFGTLENILQTCIHTHQATQDFINLAQPFSQIQATSPEIARALDRLQNPLFELASRYLDVSDNTDLEKRLARLLKPVLEIAPPNAPSVAELASALSPLMIAARPLLSIPGLGRILVGGIVNWFADHDHQHLLEKMRMGGVQMKAEERVQLGNALEGKSFVITGTMSVPREVLEDLITAHGGKLSGSVSKKTSYVVVGDSPGSKVDKARDLGVPMISEFDLRNMLN